MFKKMKLPALILGILLAVLLGSGCSVRMGVAYAPNTPRTTYGYYDAWGFWHPSVTVSPSGFYPAAGYYDRWGQWHWLP